MNKDVEFIVSKIEDKIHQDRENGEMDLRSVLYFVQTIIKHIVKKAQKKQ